MKFNLKLSRTGYLLAGSLVLGIIFIFLYISYIGQNSERDSLSGEIGKTQGSLPKVTTEARSLESQISQLESKVSQTKTALDSIKSSFPTESSFAYGERLSRLADNDGVQIMSIKASVPADEKFDAVTFSVTTFDFEVAGKIDDLLSFMRDLINSQSYASVSVNDLTINDMDKGEASLKLSLAVYGYKGG